MIKRLTITSLEFIGKNERGSTFSLYNDRTGSFICGTRKKGSVNGNHYHKGISSQKDPEVFILLTGEVMLEAKDLRTGEVSKEKIAAPCRLEIFPEVWHSLEALTDISFLELNSLEQHEKDTFYL